MLVLSKGISPVIASTILIGVVMAIGLSFMAYSISLANIQRYEINVRSILAEEASKLIVFLENENRLGNEVVLYVGIAKLINESTQYYLAVFTASQYELAAKVYTPVTPLGVEVFNGSKFQPIQYLSVDPKTVYVVTISGDYIPLTSSNVLLYEIPYRQVGLVKLRCERTVLKEYVVVTLFMRVDNEYYELLQLSHKV